MSGTAFGNKGLFINPFVLPLGQKGPSISKKKKVVILAGPTGVGKTKLSLMIARAIGGEIISADSMQVYRGMDIGTAKIKPEEQGNVRHHLIDSRDIDETFNVVDFFHDAHQALREIFGRDHVPIVTGGTGFYIHALIYGPPRGPASVPEVRKKLEKEMDEKGSLAMFERLKELDPEYALTITFRDRHKIIRALEIMTLTNQKVSFFEKGIIPSQEFDFRCWFVHMPKENLYPILDSRCEKMIAEGFIDEVKKLQEHGLENNKSARQAIGYRQCLDYLKTAQSGDDWTHFMEAFKQASRRYAKRQFTWFRKEPLFRWLNVHKTGLENSVEMIIQDYEQN
ncbi:MAG TPA: tRNA (adenosine(37)-N6)-dimethylallyltransferase MiaA [Rhabdochlamydiaceae bacterium]|nr:tRNA (adenosine(37)-N6)-dimethylallyltransferase MiaA [Rhabdochlamydiaceae bacterium]